MASLHERENGKYEVRWRNRGEAKNYSRTFTTKEHARACLREAEAAWDARERYTGPAVADADRLSLRKLLRDYLRERKLAVSAGAIYQENIALTLFLDWLESEEPGRLLLPDRLTRNVLAGFHGHLTDTRGNSIGTANTRVRFVEAWWRWLFDSDDLPERSVPQPKRLQLKSPAAPPPPAAPTWAEMDAAIACATGWYAHLFTVMRFTGLRCTQVLRLLRTDLDVGTCRLTIRGELGKSKQERAGRVVPVSAYLVAEVLSWSPDPRGYLVPSPLEAWHAKSRSTQPMQRTAWNKQAEGAWRRAKVREEVWGTKARPDGGRFNGHPIHCFRAGFATMLRAAGVLESDVKALVGHAGSVTSNRYTDLSQVPSVREAVGMIPALDRGVNVVSFER